MLIVTDPDDSTVLMENTFGDILSADVAAAVTGVARPPARQHRDRNRGCTSPCTVRPPDLRLARRPRTRGLLRSVSRSMRDLATPASPELACASTAAFDASIAVRGQPADPGRPRVHHPIFTAAAVLTTACPRMGSTALTSSRLSRPRWELHRLGGGAARARGTAPSRCRASARSSPRVSREVEFGVFAILELEPVPRAETTTPPLASALSIVAETMLPHLALPSWASIPRPERRPSCLSHPSALDQSAAGRRALDRCPWAARVQRDHSRRCRRDVAETGGTRPRSRIRLRPRRRPASNTPDVLATDVGDDPHAHTACRVAPYTPARRLVRRRGRTSLSYRHGSPALRALPTRSSQPFAATGSISFSSSRSRCRRSRWR